jgi:biotin transport system ATP-binding protein
MRPSPSTPPSVVIEMSDVAVVREERTILAGITVALRERRVAVVGANGSGKSTFLRLCNGLIVPDRGRVRVDGIDTRERPDAVRRIAAFAFQNPENQLLMPTVAEDVALAAPRQTEPGAIDALLRELRIEHLRDRLCSTLSGGEKQLVAFAGILAAQPRVVLVDEVTTMLDLVNTIVVRHVLHAIPQTIVMTTHDLELAAACERVIYLRDGQIAADGEPREVLARYRADTESEAFAR